MVDGCSGRASPAVLATIAFGVLILSVSAICSMPTIVLAKEKSVQNASLIISNSSDTNTTNNIDYHSARIEFTKTQASWFGSIVFFVQPIGSVCSGFIQEKFGRKKCMMGVTIPQLVGWIILYFATNVETLFFASIMMGLSIGFMEAPAMSFLGEVIEPDYRGTLATFSEVFLLLGTSFDYLIAGSMPWRLGCLTAAAIPILAFLCILIVPESPTWLLSKGRYRDALDSLCWLRGWVHADVVRQEYVDLIAHLKLPSGPDGSPLKEIDGSIAVGHQIRKEEKKSPRLLLLFERRVFEPLFLVVLLFFVGHCTSLLGMRPKFYHEFSKIDSSNISESSFFYTMSGALLVGSLAGAASIRILGKRPLVFISLGGTTVSCLVLAAFLFKMFTFSWNALTLFVFVGFFSGLGVLPIPWILTCEVFPTDARGVAAGIAAGCSYLLSGVVIVTYYPLLECMDVSTLVLIYGIIGLIGLIYMYFMLPETEGKTLAEVEILFNKHKSLTSPD